MGGYLDKGVQARHARYSTRCFFALFESRLLHRGSNNGRTIRGRAAWSGAR